MLLAVKTVKRDWCVSIRLLMMTSAQVVEMSVNVTSNSPSQDYTHPDDHNLPSSDSKVNIRLVHLFHCFFSCCIGFRVAV